MNGECNCSNRMYGTNVKTLRRLNGKGCGYSGNKKSDGTLVDGYSVEYRSICDQDDDKLDDKQLHGLGGKLDDLDDVDCSEFREYQLDALRFHGLDVALVCKQFHGLGDLERLDET